MSAGSDYVNRLIDTIFLKNSGTSRAIIGKGTQYIKMIECPESAAPVLQLPVPGGGVANGDDQNRNAADAQHSIFDFHARYKQGVTITT
ncbi:hypothetical protein PLEOSDRAFT_1105998 [Pleurotus ostreatus PC15]|uniref:Uncharacterized protein n=1 Tax=Pleurotus ostreatus (strain PC15) TaxID=1137138 RepID=A0A067NGC8_PLEO1|nr:hypothetical protein PLEOSDRAFT_1105998 [Pleurotus ostreatus PC15]